MKYFVYILFSEKLNKYYIGSTSGIEQRLAGHNRGQNTFTRTGIPWVLKYSEELPSKAEAMQREKYIKSR